MDQGWLTRRVVCEVNWPHNHTCGLRTVPDGILVMDKGTWPSSTKKIFTELGRTSSVVKWTWTESVWKGSKSPTSSRGGPRETPHWPQSGNHPTHLFTILRLDSELHTSLQIHSRVIFFFRLDLVWSWDWKWRHYSIRRWSSSARLKSRL